MLRQPAFESTERLVAVTSTSSLVRFVGEAFFLFLSALSLSALTVHVRKDLVHLVHHRDVSLVEESLQGVALHLAFLCKARVVEVDARTENGRNSDSVKSRH